MNEGRTCSTPSVLDTDRLTLRPWSVDDVAGFHRIWGDPQVLWWGTPHTDLEESARLLEERVAHSEASAPGLGSWAVIERRSGEVVGNAFLRSLESDDGPAELGYHVVSSRWGEGIATEVARCLLTYASLALGVEEVIALVHVDNVPSRRVVEKIGLVRDGEMVHGGLAHDVYRHVNEPMHDPWEPEERDWP